MFKDVQVPSSKGWAVISVPGKKFSALASREGSTMARGPEAIGLTLEAVFVAMNSEGKPILHLS